MSDLRPWVSRLLEWNNGRVASVDGGHPNPRVVEGEGWYRALTAAHPAIRAEWDAFRAAGGDLPLIEDTLGSKDQNEGSYWKLMPFVVNFGPVASTHPHFPVTTKAFMAVPGLRSASWSVLGPGGWLPEHVGPNAGCLRFLVGVDCGAAAITIAGQEAPFIDGEGVLFEDTVPHSVRNPGPDPRVLVLCDLTRPIRGVRGLVNQGVQRTLHTMTPAYNGSAKRGSVHFERMNAGIATRP